MRLKISTEVSASHLSVKEGFTEELFLKLNPPFPPVKLIKFDGCTKGDKVQLELNFLLFKQRWHSDITYDLTDEHTFQFIDIGVKLPFFLKRWKHHHIVNRINDQKSEVIDDITFSSPFWVMDILLFPALYLQFLYRKPIYKKIFNKV
ncbi:MAG: hypothetical protein AAF843_01935 [Bacteroidota bacterium]|mgnify:CR=1 FL=1